MPSHDITTLDIIEAWRREYCEKDGCDLQNSGACKEDITAITRCMQLHYYARALKLKVKNWHEDHIKEHPEKTNERIMFD